MTIIAKEWANNKKTNDDRTREREWETKNTSAISKTRE